MIGTQRLLANQNNSSEINIAPLIDMVFILLIFFLVTTSFVREAGVNVERPRASTGEALEPNAIQVGLTSNGTIFVDGREVNLLSLRAAVRDRLRKKQVSVLIISDRATRTDALVNVIDECRQAGAEQIHIATEKE